jgi:vacuolar-type H+-ATPase subunit E/Vma4
VSPTKRKNTQNECQASLIPVIERQEQQLRMELKRVQNEAESHIRHAEEQAERHARESRLNISELIEQRRRDRLAELQKQAELISQSSEKHRIHLQQKAKKNMVRAVKRVVNAVTGVGDQT